MKRISAAPKSVSWHLADILAVAIASSLLCLLGPFGFDDVTAKASRDFFYRIWAVEYPRQERPKIAVVLLGDSDLGDQSWPVPYRTHAAALQSLLSFKPAAVAIDLAFVDERPDPTVSELIDSIKKLHSAGIPVYLAAPEPATTGAPREIRDDLRDLVKAGVAVLGDVTAGGLSGRSLLYRLANEHGPTPLAPLIYHDYCLAHKTLSCDHPSPAKEFELWWAAPPPEASCVSDEESAVCGRISPSPWQRGIKLFLKGLLSRFHQYIPISEVDPIPLPPHPTVSWTNLRLNRLSENMKEALKGAVVFYSANVALARDVHFNPVYGKSDSREVSGVYYHSMALDNLLTLRGKVVEEAKIDDVTHSLILIGIFCATAFLVRIGFALIISDDSLEYIDLFSWFLCAAIVAWVEFGFFRISPGNWIGALLAVNTGNLLRVPLRRRFLNPLFGLAD